MSLFGRSSSAAFSYGQDQGVDSTLKRVRFASTDNPNVIRATFTLSDGIAVTSDLNLAGINPFDQGLSSTEHVEFNGCTLQHLDLDGNRIQNVGDPVEANDAANKTYVDSLISGLSLKAPVRCASTTAGNLATSFADGQVLDGVTLAVGDRILLKNQADAKENGVYVVSGGQPARSNDADNTPGNEVRGGMFVFVQEGTANAETGWVLTSPDGDATLGTDHLVFTQFSAFTYTAGTGLSLSNRQFSVTYGSSSGTACQGNDSRLSDSRQCNNSFDSASTARTNLGLGSMATKSSVALGTDVSGTLPFGNGGTGTTSIASGYVKSNGTTLSSVTSIPYSDISSTPTFMVGSNNLSEITNASTARSTLGLGSMATQASNSVAITGGTISGITLSQSALTTTATTVTQGSAHHWLKNGTSGTPTRWAVVLYGDESGSGNTGSDYGIFRYADDNTYLSVPLSIKRATGKVRISNSTMDAIGAEQTIGISAFPRVLAGTVVMTDASPSESALGNGWTSSLVSATPGRVRVSFAQSFTDYNVQLTSIYPYNTSVAFSARLTDKQPGYFDIVTFSTFDGATASSIFDTDIKVDFLVFGY